MSYTYDHPRPSLTADICVFAIEGKKREILLVRRRNDPYKGCWALPGGFADENEPLEETAKRELMEESGVSGCDMTLSGVYSAPGRDPRGWVVSAAFLAEVNKEEITVCAGDDAADAAWFLIKEGADGLYLINGNITLPLSPENESYTFHLAFDHAKIISDALCRLKSR